MSVTLNTIFFLLFGIIVSFSSGQLVEMMLINAAAQIVLFIVVAVIPYLRSGRISYVDIAWPFGVSLIGFQILLFGEGDPIRQGVVAAVYFFIGLRMGVAAVIMGQKTGVIYKYEFPRYQYRRMVLEKSGSKYLNFHIVAEIMAQGFANITVLALPGFLLANNASGSFHGLEILGLVIWGVAYFVESTADAQKLLFVSKNAKGVCNIGLWKYSRHPNYFAEWLVWTGLVIASLPTLFSLYGTESILVWCALLVGVLCASIMMYITLVYLTGAKPAEYYSVQKRAEYSDYQTKTNMFFPWFPKS